jgi:hypothetical protein
MIMRNTQYANNSFGSRLNLSSSVTKKTAVGVLLIVALLAFEIFNFDTTQFALKSLLGEMRFLGIMWATILAIAFCSIDFAGLVRLFTPESNNNESKEVWYLTGAWLLGATMNAVMTWWAVNLTLLNHDFGNEVLSREQLLLYVPIFVAVLVWLTRILFIGAFSVAGDQIFDFHGKDQTKPVQAKSAPQRKAVPAPAPQPQRKTPVPVTAAPKSRTYQQPAAKPQQPAYTAAPSQPELFYEDLDTPVMAPPPQPQMPQQSPNSRVRQRPPRSTTTSRSPMSNGAHSSSKHN